MNWQPIDTNALSTFMGLCAELVDEIEELYEALQDNGLGWISPETEALISRARASLIEKGKQGFVIRYTDGFYDMESGYPVILREATRYNTREEAEAQAEGLCGVDCIEEV